MNCPFPGMDPYFEQPVLWEGVHARLIVAIANQLQPRIDPRYVTSIEERVTATGSDTVEIEDLEIHETRVEILDADNAMKLVALIEVLSPTRPPALDVSRTRESSRKFLAGECHLIEIDLLRGGRHVVAIPEWRVESLKPFESLCCVSRWPHRNRFELYPRRLRERLPRLAISLADGDPDVTLDLQAALEQVSVEGRYARRIRYHQPCEPLLDPEDQVWAGARLDEFRAARPDLFPQG